MLRPGMASSFRNISPPAPVSFPTRKFGAHSSVAFTRYPHRFACDCIVPVVNRGNPVSDLSLRQLKRIYNGDNDNWSQLGGPDLAIEIVSRNRDSGTDEVWQQVVLQGEPARSGSAGRKSKEAVVESVARNTGATVYIGLGYLNARLKPLKVGGIMGSTRTLERGTLEFINFTLDPGARQGVIRRAGYIPLN